MLVELFLLMHFHLLLPLIEIRGNTRHFYGNHGNGNYHGNDHRVSGIEDATLQTEVYLFQHPIVH